MAIGDYMTSGNKTDIAYEIKEMIHSFSEKYLNKELDGYAIKLSEDLSRKRKLNITRGKKEIWAASIIYVIARLNFLFDKQNESHITADTICNFFNAKKSTVGNKASQIEKHCKLRLGEEGYCSKDITDSFTFFETPEGFILPQSMIRNREINIEFADSKEADELGLIKGDILKEIAKKGKIDKEHRCYECGT